MLLDFVLYGRIPLLSFHLRIRLCSLHLLRHLFVIIQFDLLNHDEVKPIDIFCHLAVFHLVWVLAGLFQFLHLLLVLCVELSMLTCFSAFFDACLRICESLKFLQYFTFWHQYTTIGLYQRGEIREQGMAQLQKVEAWIVQFALSQALQE